MEALNLLRVSSCVHCRLVVRCVLTKRRNRRRLVERRGHVARRNRRRGAGRWCGRRRTVRDGRRERRGYGWRFGNRFRWQLRRTPCGWRFRNGGRRRRRCGRAFRGHGRQWRGWYCGKRRRRCASWRRGRQRSRRLHGHHHRPRRLRERDGGRPARHDEVGAVRELRDGDGADGQHRAQESRTRTRRAFRARARVAARSWFRARACRSPETPSTCACS